MKYQSSSPLSHRIVAAAVQPSNVPAVAAAATVVTIRLDDADDDDDDDGW